MQLMFNKRKIKTISAKNLVILHFETWNSVVSVVRVICPIGLSVVIDEDGNVSEYRGQRDLRPCLQASDSQPLLATRTHRDHSQQNTFILTT